MLIATLLSLAMAADRPSVMPYAIDESHTTREGHQLTSVDLHLTKRALAGRVLIALPRQADVSGITLITDGGELPSAPRLGQRRSLRVNGGRYAVVRFPLDAVDPEELGTVTLRIHGTTSGESWQVDSVLLDQDVPGDRLPSTRNRHWFVTMGSGLGLDGMWATSGAGLLLGPLKLFADAALNYTVVCRTPNPHSPCDENLGGLGAGTGWTVGGRVPVSSGVELVPQASYRYVGGKAGQPDTIDRHRVGLELSVDYAHRESKHHRSGIRQTVAPGVQLRRDADGISAPQFYFRFESWFPVGSRWER